MSGIPQIIAEPLNAEVFRPFGQVVEGPAEPGRKRFNEFLENARAGAGVDLSIATYEPLVTWPMQVKELERHPHSSQTFIPIKAARYLVIVAPDKPDGSPDLAGARCFLANGKQGITYRRGLWHHGMTVVDDTAEMAILMWCDGSSGDEEFLDVETRFEVLLPDEV